MKTVIAVFRIGTCDPNAGLTHTGNYDKDGNAILKKKQISILPGDFYTCRTQEEYDELFDMGAIREMNEIEKINWAEMTEVG